MSLSAFWNTISSGGFLEMIANPKVSEYNAAYRNYRKFQALEAHELRDMGITVQEQQSQTLQHFLDAQSQY